MGEIAASEGGDHSEVQQASEAAELRSRG